MTFLKLLKQTPEFEDQATKLEGEYMRLYYANGQSKDPTLGGKSSIQVPAGKQDAKKEDNQEAENGDGTNNDTIEIPKLDLSIIYMQQNQ